MPADDVDHVVPLHVRPEWGLRPENLQSLCRRHHNRKTRAETDARRRGVVLDAAVPPPRRELPLERDPFVG